MCLVTTISEISTLKNISVDSIRWQLTKQNIQPIDHIKWNLNGYIGKPYKKEDIETALKSFNPDKTIQLRTLRNNTTKQPKEYVLKVLNSNIKSRLWNKKISDWKNKDWIEFNKLKL